MIRFIDPCNRIYGTGNSYRTLIGLALEVKRAGLNVLVGYSSLTNKKMTRFMRRAWGSERPVTS
jgi:hypothetical protein